MALLQHRAFSALRHRKYRWYFASGMGMSASQGIEQLAMAWLVLDLTGSLSQLGGVVFVRGMPWLVCGLFGGVLADRYSRLKLLYVTQTATALNMTVLAVAVSTGIADIHYAYVSSFIMGIVSSLTQPARQAMIRNVIDGDADMLNAVALNSFTMNLSRIVWPTLAGGVIAATGTGGAYVICAVASTVGIVFLLPLHGLVERTGSRKNSPIADLVDGFRYTRSVPLLVMVMSLAIGIGMSGLSFQNVAPAFAREVMHFSAGEAGLFIMASGIGSLIGTSLLIAFEPQRRHIVLVGLAFGFGCSLLALSANPYYLMAFLIMGVYGLFNSSIPVLAQTIFQVVVPQEYLGRVNSMMMVAPGLAALVTLPMGVVADAVGLRPVVAGIGLFLMTATVIVALIQLPRVHRLETSRAATAAVTATTS